MRKIGSVMAVWSMGLTLFGAALGATGFTRDFRLEDCTWANKGDQNPHFILRPGRRLVLAGEDEEGAEILLWVTVTRGRETISFETARGVELTVSARVIEEREWEDGELVEVSRNWFARCVETSDIYYFGEEVEIYEDDEIVSNAGAWRAGEDGAQPGIIMPGTFLLGAKYFQEMAPDVAMDRAKHVDMGLTVTVEAGEFSDCVAVKETSTLEPGAASFKVYCPGVGLVIDDVVDLIELGSAGDDE